jgi:cytochrome c
MLYDQLIINKMNSFEINKIIAAILVTILLVFGISKISDIIFKVNETGVVSYKVEALAGSSSDVKAETSADISTFLALGNIDTGKKVFNKCKSCHSVAKGGSNKIGPALYSVVGRVAGSVSDYKYSQALTSYGKEWTFAELNGFLTKPAKWIPKNKMGFGGVKDKTDRASVILYLNQNSDNPQPLP